MEGAGLSRAKRILLPTALKIRPAKLADLDAVEALEDLVFEKDELSRRSLRYYIVSPTARFIVADHDDAIAADAIVALRRRSAVARLYSIAVRPDLVGSGIGRQMLTACESLVREQGRRALRLEVRSDNEVAIRFYEAAGYTRFAMYPDYYEDGTAALRYEKRFA